MTLLHITGVVFLSRGIGLSLALVVDSFQFVFVGGTFLSFCLVTLVGVLAAILYYFRYVVGSHVGMWPFGCFMLLCSSPSSFNPEGRG